MAENIKHLDDDNFRASIGEGVTLVDFYADWCGPCRMIAPIISELASEMHGQASIAKVDIDKSQMITSNYGITSVPTLILFKNGVEVKRVIGVQDKKSLKSIIQAAL